MLGAVHCSRICGLVATNAARGALAHKCHDLVLAAETDAPGRCLHLFLLISHQNAASLEYAKWRLNSGHNSFGDQR